MHSPADFTVITITHPVVLHVESVLEIIVTYICTIANISMIVGSVTSDTVVENAENVLSDKQNLHTTIKEID